MEMPRRSVNFRLAPRAELLAAFDAQMRGPMSLKLPDGAHEEQDGPVFRSWGSAPRGCVLPGDLHALDAHQLDTLIQGQIKFFAERSLAFEWKTYAHDQTAQLTFRLRRAGFVPEARENLVIGRLSELNQTPQLPAGVSLRQVRSRADTNRMADLLTEVEGEDCRSLGEQFFKDAEVNPDHVVLLVAEAGAKVIGTARVNLEPGAEFATLWAGSTLPKWRSQGIYRATVAYRARLAAERGYQYLQVDASEESRPILERLGFLTVSSTTPYVWSPAT